MVAFQCFFPVVYSIYLLYISINETNEMQGKSRYSSYRKTFGGQTAYSTAGSRGFSKLVNETPIVSKRVSYSYSSSGGGGGGGMSHGGSMSGMKILATNLLPYSNFFIVSLCFHCNLQEERPLKTMQHHLN